MTGEENAVVVASPVSEIENAVAESTTEIKEAIVEAEAKEEQDWDKLVDRIAKASAGEIYDKIKKLITDLLDATEDAAEMAAADMEAATPVEETPAAEATEEEKEEDVAPKRSHPLFRKPMKKD
jgi:hypothetical protein